MLKKITFGFFVAILLSSCGGKEPRPFLVEVILDAPISDNGKYPSSMGTMLSPIDYNEEMFLLPKPIKVRRVDTGSGVIELNAFYYESKGEPTLDFYQEWMPIFFKDSIPPKELLAPKGNLETTIDWVQKNADKQFFIVLSSENIEALADKENVLFAEDESAISKHIVTILKTKSDAKINLAIVSTPPPPAPVPKPVNNTKGDYGKTSDDIDMNESFHGIWEKAESYIGTPFNEIDHDNEHPELFSIMVKAGLAAIQQGKAKDMVEHLDEIKTGNTDFFRKVYPGHEKRWNTIYHLVEEEDTIALNKILAKLQDEMKDAKSKMVEEF